MEINHPAPRMYATCLVFIASLLYVYEFFVRVTPGVLSSQLMAALHIEAGLFGVISASFFYAYAPMQIVAGLCVDRFGVKRCLVIAMAVCALSTAIFAMAYHAPLAIISRFLLGFGASFAFVGPIVLAGRWFHARYFALVVGSIQVMGCLGAMMGGAPVVRLMHLLGWRAMLFATALLGVALVLMFIWTLQEYPPGAKREDQAARVSMRQCMCQVLACRQSWGIVLAAFACWTPIAVFAELWGVPFLVRSYHLSDYQAALGTMMIWLGVAIGSPVVGYLSDYIQSRKVPVLICLSFGLLASLWLLFMPSTSWFVTEVELFVLGLTAAAQPVTFAMMRESHTPDVAGTAAGLTNMGVVSTGMILQPFVGYYLQHGWQHHFAHGTPVYSVVAYQHALSIVPAVLAIVCLVVIFGVKETARSI